MAFRWKDDHTLLFLETYKNYECLWNNKCEKYHKTDIREKAYISLLTEMNLPQLTVADIKSKIKTIRTRYCSELTKIRKSERSGAGADDLYKPRLFWFKEADSFLRAVCSLRDSSSNMKVSLNSSYNTEAETTQEANEELVESQNVSKNQSIDNLTEESVYGSNANDDNIQTLVTQSSDSDIQHSSLHTSTPSGKRAIKRKIDNNVNLIQGAIHKLQKLSDDSKKANDPHEFDVFCKSLAIQLKKMPLQRALICQEKLQAVMTQERLSNLISDHSTSLSPTSPLSIHTFTSPDPPSPISVPEHLPNYDDCESYNKETRDVISEAIYSMGGFDGT